MTLIADNAASVSFGLGALCIVALVFRVIRGDFRLQEILIGLIGILLIAMFIFDQIEWSVGADGSFKSHFTQSLLSNDANVRQSVDKIDKRLSTLEEKLRTLGGVDPALDAKFADIELASGLSAEYDENSKFTILVFYRDEQQDKAMKLVAQLIRNGYKASSAATDLKEAAVAASKNTAWILWKDSAKSAAVRIKTVIADIAPGSTIATQEVATELKQGDVQVLLF